MRGSVVIKENVAESSVSFDADQCQLDEYWVDGSFDIDIGNEDWVVASLDASLRQGETGEPTAFVGALRVCRATGPSCDAGDIELSIDIEEDKNVVVTFSAAEGVIGLRDVSGHWSCEASLENPEDAQCTHEALSITLPGVNP